MEIFASDIETGEAITQVADHRVAEITAGRF
jgi:hypothetical protein